MALGHASILEKLKNILALREKQLVRGVSDRDAEEVVKCPEISHHELQAKAHNDVT
jgi:hypothetical protein